MKLDDSGLDTLLGRWRAPARDDAAWDERADAILAAAVAAKAKESGTGAEPPDELPALDAVDGEPRSGVAGVSLMEDASGRDEHG